MLWGWGWFPHRQPKPNLLIYIRAHLKRGVTERGVFAFACQYIVSLRRRTGNRTVTQMRHPLLVESTTKLCATIACQYTVGTSRHGDIVLRSRSPRKCHYPPFAYPLFKRAQTYHWSKNHYTHNFYCWGITFAITHTHISYTTLIFEELICVMHVYLLRLLVLPL